MKIHAKPMTINENNMKKISEANELKAKLDGKEINIQMEANEDGNLYGNLGPRQIRERLINDFSIDIEPGNIVLDNISAIGSYDVTLRIYDDISATLKLEITKKI